MKAQIRQGLFETNSSSTHSIVIGNNGEDIYTKLPERVCFYGGEFGWEHVIYDDTETKASYLYTSIVNAYDDIDGAVEKIKEVLSKWNIETEFEPLDNHNCFNSFSYVDHSYENIDLINKLLENEDLLMNYLFSDGSFVETGNDNDDTDFEGEKPKNVLLDYYKGN